MNPTIDEIKTECKNLFIVYTLLAICCCYLAQTFNYHPIYILILMLKYITPFSFGFYHKSFAAVFFMSVISFPVYILLYDLSLDHYPLKMTQAQIIEEYIGLFSSLNVAYFVIIIYYLGEKAGEYCDKNRKKNME